MSEDKPQVMPPVPPFVRFVASAIPMVFDDSLSYYEALCALWKYVQGMTDVINNNATLEEEYIQLTKDMKVYMDTYFDNLDVQEEINNKLDTMAEDGTLQNLIYAAINVPQGMALSLRRLGRKLFYSEDQPYNMQGGCRISENLVAYALWDSVTKYPVSNRIVIMNINTGEIIRYADYSFGWCNSIALYDGKLYIAERGKEIDSEGNTQNNGIIHVLSVDTLAVVDTITMSFNVNAIACYDGKFYLLQEGSNTVYKYDDTLTTLEDTISLDLDFVNYHQNICVDSQYIYLLSTQPSNALNIFDVTDGTRIRSYNIPKYGGLYRIGELQWIDKIDDDGNLLITGDVFTYHENIAQFFIANYKKNVDNKSFDAIYAQTLYADSTVDHFDADGSSAKPFTSLNEAINTAIDNIVLVGSDEEYKYCYASDKKFVRFQNCVFAEGAWCQYGDYEFVDCTINNLVNEYHTDCGLFVRRANFYFQRTEFDVNNVDYCIYNQDSCLFKFTQPTFSNYAVSVFANNHPTSEVFLNNGNNIPYIPRAYGTRFKLSANSDINAYQTGSYLWSSYTDLSESQIDELIKNCARIEIGYEAINKGETDYIVIRNKKANTSSYTITDIVISSGSINERIAKIIFSITKTGLTISSNSCQTFDGTTAQIVGSPAQDQVITIKSVSFFDDRQ